MNTYYELSYVDEFGNGDYKYFFCTEEQIKAKAKSLFKKEKKLAVSEEEIKADGQSKKPFEFNDDTCKGYVVKEVGFILPHYIEWSKIEVKNKNYQSVLYLVEENGHWAISDKCNVFSNLLDAKKLAREIKDYGETANVDEDGNRLYNGVVRKSKHGWYCRKCHWCKTSYEYDEWDIVAITRTITPKKVKRLNKGNEKTATNKSTS